MEEPKSIKSEDDVTSRVAESEIVHPLLSLAILKKEEESNRSTVVVNDEDKRLKESFHETRMNYVKESTTTSTIECDKDKNISDDHKSDDHKSDVMKEEMTNEVKDESQSRFSVVQVVSNDAISSILSHTRTQQHQDINSNPIKRKNKVDLAEGRQPQQQQDQHCSSANAVVVSPALQEIMMLPPAYSATFPDGTTLKPNPSMAPLPDGSDGDFRVQVTERDIMEEKLDDLVGKVNGSSMQRKPPLPKVHDGQIVIRLKRKRLVVLDYGVTPDRAVVPPWITYTPEGAGTKLCRNPACSKVGVPVVLWDTDPTEIPTLYVRSGFCFLCQRDQNEKRRAYGKLSQRERRELKLQRRGASHGGATHHGDVPVSEEERPSSSLLLNAVTRLSPLENINVAQDKRRSEHILNFPHPQKRPKLAVGDTSTTTPGDHPKSMPTSETTSTPLLRPQSSNLIHGGGTDKGSGNGGLESRIHNIEMSIFGEVSSTQSGGGLLRRLRRAAKELWHGYEVSSTFEQKPLSEKFAMVEQELWGVPIRTQGSTETQPTPASADAAVKATATTAVVTTTTEPSPQDVICDERLPACTASSQPIKDETSNAGTDSCNDKDTLTTHNGSNQAQLEDPPPMSEEENFLVENSENKATAPPPMQNETNF